MKRLVAAFLLIGLLSVFAMPYFRPTLVQFDGYDGPSEPDEWSKAQSTKIQQISFTYCPPFTILGEIILRSDEICVPAPSPAAAHDTGIRLRFKAGRDPPRPSFKRA